MDEELFEFAKDNDLSLDEAEELQDFAEEHELDWPPPKKLHVDLVY